MKCRRVHTCPQTGIACSKLGRSTSINTHTRTQPLDSFSTCSIQAPSIINTFQLLQASTSTTHARTHYAKPFNTQASLLSNIFPQRIHPSSISSFQIMLVIVFILTMAAIHFMRPDITHALAALISQKCRDYTPAVIWDSMVAAGHSLKGYYDDIMLRADDFWSLPWQEYYDQAASLVECFVSWSAAFEEAASKAGYPGWGLFTHIGLYLGVIILVAALFAFIRWVLKTIWDLITEAINTLWVVCTWILYPFHFTFRLLCGRY